MSAKPLPTLTYLGRSTPAPKTPDEAVLDRVPNRCDGGPYVVRFSAPEFTVLCAVTGQPDFAHVMIDYVPKDWHYFGRLGSPGSTKSFSQCGHRFGGGRAKRSRMACLIAGMLGCGGGPPILFFPSRCFEAAGLEECVGDHRHQRVSM
jgi:hypothetical protein